jgi:predicted metal-binding membrane protein
LLRISQTRVQSSAPWIRLDGQLVALVCLLLGLAVVGWLVTDQRMAGMDAGPGTDLGTFGFYVTAWVVMMAAMMFPSVSPMVIAYSRIHRRQGELNGRGAKSGATALFVGGYLVSWAAFGIAAYLLFAFVRSFSLDVFSWHRGGPYLAGAVIVGAAVYQLTPLKDVCLRKCRGPLAFILGYWRDGYGGALRMGIEHGLWCVGCCWALMAALFALGMMSLGWMVFLAALIATEKLLPWEAIANRGIAVLLVVLGVSVGFWPERVPELTLPSSPKAAAAMRGMGMDRNKSPEGMGGNRSAGKPRGEAMTGAR